MFVALIFIGEVSTTSHGRVVWCSPALNLACLNAIYRSDALGKQEVYWLTPRRKAARGVVGFGKF